VRKPVTHTDRHSYSNRHSYGNPHSYGNSHSYSDCYGNSHCSCYGNSHCNSYGNRHSYCDSCAQVNADAKAASDTTASPVGRLLRVLNPNSESLRETTLEGFRE